jgi:hypothetical protein
MINILLENQSVSHAFVVCVDDKGSIFGYTAMQARKI